MIDYYLELLYFIKKRCSNADYAEDLVQETFAKVISIEKEKNINNKRAFLYKVAKNIIIDKARENKNIKEIYYEKDEFIVENSQPENIVIEQDRKKILMFELSKLPPMRKEAFVLHILEGYSRQEVAKIMGISLSAVEKHISRASIDLKKRLNNKDNF